MSKYNTNKYYMNKYKEKLFKDFIKTTDKKVPHGINDSLFDHWLYEQWEIIKYYEPFLITMGLIPSRGVLEFDKGPVDTILQCASNDTLGICLSDFYRQPERHEKIACLNGKVEIRNNDIILKYDNKERVLDFINTYITQFPASRETIDLLIDISLKGKNIFIGAYGNQTDKNMNRKLKELYDLKQEIEAFTGKSVEGEVVKTSRYYMAAITPKLKYKKKN